VCVLPKCSGLLWAPGGDVVQLHKHNRAVVQFATLKNKTLKP